MNTKQIADKLIKYCQEGEFIKAQKELYGDSVISREPEAQNGFEKETTGIKAVNEKIEKFMSGVEKLYSNEVTDLSIAGNSFSVRMAMDIKMKGQERMKMEEIGVYTVKDGKIVLEEFFW